MKDLRTRMRIFDEVPAPSYWDEIELRASSAPEAASPVRTTRPALLLVAALLLALLAGGAVLILSGNLDLPGSAAPRLAHELDGDIYLADQDGGNAVLIADGVAYDTDGSLNCGTLFGEGPMWAPDGRHFAYRSWWHECPGEVHVRDAEGRLVASVPGFGWDIGWSPDSTRFATWIEFGETIAIYGLDGERQALLTVTPECEGSGDHDPQWSPDGQTVVVTNSPCALPVDGGPPIRLSTDDPRRSWMWAYSPDGSRVAYLTAEGDAETYDTTIVIAEAGGTVLQVVHDEALPGPWYHDLVWSPSGDRLLFGETPVWDDGYPNVATQLRQIDVETGEVTTIAAEPLITPIRFSPEGDRILYSTRDADFAPIGLWSMDADGSNAQLLVAGTAVGDWQPLPAPSETPTPAEPSAAPSDEAVLPVGSFVWFDPASPQSPPLEPGSNGPPITVTIAAPGWACPGWHYPICLLAKGEEGTVLADGDGGTVSADNFWESAIIYTSTTGGILVYDDACLREHPVANSPARTAAEVAAALAAQPGRGASVPEDVTVGGYPGKMVTLHVPDDLAISPVTEPDGFTYASFDDCRQGEYSSYTLEGLDGVGAGSWRWHQGPGQIDTFWIVEVDGAIVIIDAMYRADTPAERIEEMRAIVESATFE
jgi:Tol biopolymer transport system component